MLQRLAWSIGLLRSQACCSPSVERWLRLRTLERRQHERPSPSFPRIAARPYDISPHYRTRPARAARPRPLPIQESAPACGDAPRPRGPPVATARPTRFGSFGPGPRAARPLDITATPAEHRGSGGATRGERGDGWRRHARERPRNSYPLPTPIFGAISYCDEHPLHHFHKRIRACLACGGTCPSLGGLGGHLKTGQLWTGQNRPVGRAPPSASLVLRSLVKAQGPCAPGPSTAAGVGAARRRGPAHAGAGSL